MRIKISGEIDKARASPEYSGGKNIEQWNELWKQVHLIIEYCVNDAKGFSSPHNSDVLMCWFADVLGAGIETRGSFADDNNDAALMCW